MWQPNFAFGHLTKSINKSEVNKFDLSSVEYMACSSEPVLYETISNFLNHFSNTKLRNDVIQNCYGMAENTIYMAASKNRKLKFLSIDFNELKKKS